VQFSALAPIVAKLNSQGPKVQEEKTRQKILDDKKFREAMITFRVTVCLSGMKRTTHFMELFYGVVTNIGRIIWGRIVPE
jgi:hypothetical protein